jgi:hypothetical protein
MRGVVRGVAIVYLLLAAGNDYPLLSNEDEKALSSVLEWWTRKLPSDGTYFVVSPITFDFSQRLREDTPANTKLKDYILQEIQIEGLNFSPLVDQFIERNKKRVHIKIAPALEGKVLLDKTDAFPKYFQDGGGGWEKWYKDNPKARGHCAVSVPVMDKGRELIMVYVELSANDLVGKGTIFLFKREGAKLRALGHAHLWMT